MGLGTGSATVLATVLEMGLCIRTKLERHHRANSAVARACSSAPRTTGPRHGPTLCVPTQIHPCTCSPACPSSLSVSARPPGNGAARK